MWHRHSKPCTTTLATLYKGLESATLPCNDIVVWTPLTTVRQAVQPELELH